MKKTLSFLLSVVMLVSVFSISTINTFAADEMKDAPVMHVGDTIQIECIKDDGYYAQYTCSSTAYYEFRFDTKYSGSTTGSVDFIIVDSYDEYVEWDYIDYDFPDPVSLFVKLQKGETYYLYVSTEKATYVSNLSLIKHVHDYKQYTQSAVCFVSNGESYIENGYDYKLCDKCYSWVKIPNTTIYAPKKATLSRTEYTFDGSSKKPTVKVYDRNGALISSKNYTVRYSNTVNVGKATVTVEFKGDKYIGEIVKTYTIKPVKTIISSLTAKSKGFTAKWDRKSRQVSGYQVQCATDSKFTKNKKTFTLSGTRATTKSISSLKGGTKYYVRVRTYRTVDGKKIYSNWSGYKTVKTKK